MVYRIQDGRYDAMPHQSKWDEFRTDVYQTKRDFDTFAKHTVHDISNTLSGGNEEVTSYADKFMKRQSELIYQKTPKRQKTDKMAKMARRRPVRFRRGITKRRFRRTLRRTRKPSFRRPRGKGLVRMIKKVAMDQLEPKRSFQTIANAPFNNNEVVCWALNRLTLNNATATTDAVNTTTFKAQKAFIKGIRVRGFVTNLSNVPAVFKLYCFKTKARNNKDFTTPLVINGEPMWWNPVTGREVIISNMPAIFQISPKVHPKAELKKLREYTWKLNSSRRTEGATVAGETSFAADDTSDTAHFDFYMPINRNFTKRIEDTADGLVKFTEEYYMVCKADPHAFDLEFAAAKPQLSFTSICYFKDD